MNLTAQDILIVASVTLGITAIIGISIYFLSSQLSRKSHYLEKERRVMLDDVRSSFEKEMYQINARLLANEKRWTDVNHLFLRNEKEVGDSDLGKKVPSSEFLTSNGLSQQDLTVEMDFVFVLTPFHGDFLKEFLAIKNVCDAVNLKCQRGDEEFIRGDIFNHILKCIVKANLVIANMNGRNPNVLYELGIAQALNKPTILIARNIEKIPFDIKSKRFIIYGDNEDLQTKVKAELLRIFVRNSQSSPNYIPVDLNGIMNNILANSHSIAEYRNLIRWMQQGYTFASNDAPHQDLVSYLESAGIIEKDGQSVYHFTQHGQTFQNAMAERLLRLR